MINVFNFCNWLEKRKKKTTIKAEKCCVWLCCSNQFNMCKLIAQSVVHLMCFIYSLFQLGSPVKPACQSQVLTMVSATPFCLCDFFQFSHLFFFALRLSGVWSPTSTTTADLFVVCPLTTSRWLHFWFLVLIVIPNPSCRYLNGLL